MWLIERVKIIGGWCDLSLEPIGFLIQFKWTVFRSAYSIENVATEFNFQGLDLYCVGLYWDANLLWHCTRRRIRRFSGIYGNL